MSFLNFGFLSFYPTRTEIIIFKNLFIEDLQGNLSFKQNAITLTTTLVQLILETFRMESIWLIPLCSLNFATGQPASFYEEGRNSNQKQKGFVEKQEQNQGSETRTETWCRR